MSAFKKKVLVVEDEQSIVTLIKYNLEKAGYEVIIAFNGKTGQRKAIEEQPDVIILDLMLPKLDGFEVCKQLRAQKVYTPILMLTAKDDEIDKVTGLNIGADDYMTKPFSPRELVARVNALIRRTNIIDESINRQLEEIKIGEITVNPSEYEAFYRGELIELTPKEFELLVYLIKNKGRVLTREKLLKDVWDYTFVGDTRIVDVHISHLREKIEENSRNPKYIKTIRGLGYKFEEL